jgi:transcription elongation GreA/GreB family factor
MRARRYVQRKCGESTVDASALAVVFRHANDAAALAPTRHAAASEPNHSENAEYLGVREDQALLERRIALLEERLRWAQVVGRETGDSM